LQGTLPACVISAKYFRYPVGNIGAHSFLSQTGTHSRIFTSGKTGPPWEDKDPAMKRTYSGAAVGRGAVYARDGNKNVGSGRMEILEASAPSKIVINVDFITPFEGHNTAEFTMQPQGHATI
jgi:hypothetical protein